MSAIFQGLSVLTLIDMVNARTATTLTSTSIASETYAIVTLNAANGLFVIINQDQLTDSDTASVMAGQPPLPPSRFF